MAAATEDRPDLGDISAASESGKKSLDSRTLWWLVLGLALLPLVISAIAQAITVGNSYYPYSDWGGMELFVRDIGHHPVLVGLYSRDGWSHPGPIIFYLLAIPYRLTGSSSVGLQLGALIINGAAIVGMALVARRRGGTPLLLCTLLGVGLLVRTLGPDFVRDPWVCYVTVIPFGLMVLLSWAMACGETWALPVGAALTSYLVQSHVEYLALAFPLLVWGAVCLVWLAVRRKRSGGAMAGPEPRAVVRAGVISVVITAVLWVPPVIDELINNPGNLSQMKRWIQTGTAHTLGQGFRIVGAQFGWPPEWLTHHRPPGFFGVTVFLNTAPHPVLLVPLAIAGFVLWRKRGRTSKAGRLAATVALGLVFGVIAVSRTTGIMYDYRLRWTWILGMMAFVVVAWTTWMVLSSRSPGVDRWLVRIALFGLVVLSIVNSVTAARARVDPIHRPASSTLAAFKPKVLHALPATKGDVIIRATSPGAGYYRTGLVLLLERQGIRARVDENPGNFYGKHRVHKKGPVRAIFTVDVDEDYDAVVAHPGPQRLVAYRGTLSRAARARVVAKRSGGLARLDADRKAGRIDSAEYVRRSYRLPSPGKAVAVFQTPLGSNG
jgi:hypothetical protein